MVDKTALNYDNLVDFWAEMFPYDFMHTVFDKAGIVALLKLTEFKDAFVGFDFQRTGELITPLGAGLSRHDSTLLSQKAFAIDNRFGIEKVRERGAYLVEADKIIRNQSNEFTISDVVGFSKIFQAASKVLDFAA